MRWMTKLPRTVFQRTGGRSGAALAGEFMYPISSGPSSLKRLEASVTP